MSFAGLVVSGGSSGDLACHTSAKRAASIPGFNLASPGLAAALQDEIPRCTCTTGSQPRCSASHRAGRREANARAPEGSRRTLQSCLRAAGPSCQDPSHRFSWGDQAAGSSGTYPGVRTGLYGRHAGVVHGPYAIDPHDAKDEKASWAPRRGGPCLSTCQLLLLASIAFHPPSERLTLRQLLTLSKVSIHVYLKIPTCYRGCGTQ